MFRNIVNNVNFRIRKFYLYQLFLFAEDCLSESYRNESCNQFCFRAIGPICRADVDKNFVWPMTKANNEARVPCSNNSAAQATRRCILRAKTADKSANERRTFSGEWSAVNMDQCADSDLVSLRKQVFKYHKTDNFDERKILLHVENLRNVTNFIFHVYRNVSIHDITAIIDTMNYLANAQVF